MRCSCRRCEATLVASHTANINWHAMRCVSARPCDCRSTDDVQLAMARARVADVCALERRLERCLRATPLFVSPAGAALARPAAKVCARSLLCAHHSPDSSHDFVYRAPYVEEIAIVGKAKRRQQWRREKGKETSAKIKEEQKLRR